ncbi:VanZ family protein [Anaeromicrobium sediminis]|uniref:VanZ family protein n=1 Tax=Anaeromicrobium sediminis TaxID=1478221 RepID=UPI001595F7E7|nr:VanZ family protein [Anaeromicrobium sediminis]
MYLNKFFNNKLIAWTLVILWCICIFAFSSDNAEKSSAKSKAVAQKVVEVAKTISSNNKLTIKGNLEHYIRKLAHMSEYFILAFLVCNALKYTGLRVQGQIIYSILFVLIYASLDEYHQTFVPGRDGKPFDVFIDSFGGILGICAYRIITRFKERRT